MEWPSHLPIVGGGGVTICMLAPSIYRPPVHLVSTFSPSIFIEFDIFLSFYFPFAQGKKT